MGGLDGRSYVLASINAAVADRAGSQE
jgi:hypothetical protein